MQRRKNNCVGLLAIACVTLLTVSSVSACPFCPPTRLTFSEEVANADAVVLVQWVSATKPAEEGLGNTVVEVLAVAKSSGAEIPKGERITLGKYRSGNPGDLFLLTGVRDEAIDWGDATEITEIAFQYILQSPSLESPTAERLTFFLKFLEFSDSTIAEDAFAEFAKAPYKDLLPLVDKLDRKKIRGWIEDPEATPIRLGFYGLLLGLCGTKEDADFFEAKIVDPPEEYVFGMDGFLAAYLLLKGPNGLDLIDRVKLQSEEASSADRYSVLKALRFLWTHGNGRISKARLRQSLRGLLTKPDVAELAITDLARWKDWDIQDQLMSLYDSKEVYGDKTIRDGVNKAIIRFMLVSTKDRPKQDAKESTEIPPHVKRGKRNLELLEKRDPETYRIATRFFAY